MIAALLSACSTALKRWWLIPPALVRPHLAAKFELTVDDQGRVRIFDWVARAGGQDEGRLFADLLRGMIRAAIHRGAPPLTLATVMAEELQRAGVTLLPEPPRHGKGGRR